MNISDRDMGREMQKFQSLIDTGQLRAEDLSDACDAADGRNISVEKILRSEYGIARRKLLEALASYFDCGWVEYDERLPVPFELLAGLDREPLYAQKWFPAIKEGNTVIIAAVDPKDIEMIAAVKKLIPAPLHEFRVALDEDVCAFIADFLNSAPDHLIGNERTGLAFWRNTMSRWRTRLASYRTDFTMAKTRLSLLRGGLGLIIIGGTILRMRPDNRALCCWMMIAAGLGVVIYGLMGYYRIRRSAPAPPRHQTMVEVTGATLYFFENFQFVENRPRVSPSKKDHAGPHRR